MSKLKTYLSIQHPLQESGFYTSVFDTLKGTLDTLHLCQTSKTMGKFLTYQNQVYVSYQQEGQYLCKPLQHTNNEFVSFVHEHPIIHMHDYTNFVVVIDEQGDAVQIYEWENQSLQHIGSVMLTEKDKCVQTFLLDHYLGVVCEGSDRICFFDSIHDFCFVKDLTFPKGSAPTQVFVDEKRMYLYTLAAQSNEIFVHTSRSKLTFQCIQIIPLLPNGNKQNCQSIQMCLHPLQKYIYVISNRYNIISSFEIIEGVLKQKEFVESNGKNPKFLWIDPSGRWLVVGHEKDGKLVTFQLDVDTGSLVTIQDEKNIYGLNELYIQNF